MYHCIATPIYSTRTKYSYYCKSFILSSLILFCSVQVGDYASYVVVSVVSPILFIIMNVKAVMMILKDDFFRKYFITHVLSAIVSSHNAEYGNRWYLWQLSLLLRYLLNCG